MSLLTLSLRGNKNSVGQAEGWTTIGISGFTSWTVTNWRTLLNGNNGCKSKGARLYDGWSDASIFNFWNITTVQATICCEVLSFNNSPLAFPQIKSLPSSCSISLLKSFPKSTQESLLVSSSPQNLSASLFLMLAGFPALSYCSTADASMFDYQERFLFRYHARYHSDWKVIDTF